jgi:hypothetical protein
MGTRMKWTALPVALLLAGSLAMAQNRGDGAQSGQQMTSGTLNLESKDPAIYRETAVGPSPSGDKAIGMAAEDIQETFASLSSAFANRDLNSVKQSWPSIPERPRTALQKSFAYFKTVSRNFRPESIEVNGDFAAVVGSYSGSFEKGKTTIPSLGKFRATLRKTGGRWSIDTLLCN